MQHRFFTRDDQCVPGVVSALKAHHALRMIREPVNDLALTLIAPLSAHHYYVLRHTKRLKISFKNNML